MLKMNFFEVRKFTEIVYDLFVVQKISFPEVLLIMKGGKDRHLKETAEFLSSELEKGSLLSEALFHCEKIHFDEVYVLFVKFAEKTGDLKGVFTFLKNRCNRKKQNIQRTLEASVYPLFVVVVAIVYCVLFFVHGRTLFTDLMSQNSEMLVRFGKSMFFLCLLCGAVVYLFWKNMKENKLYEAFLGMGFLIKSGVNVSLAVGYGILMVGPDSRYGKMFAQVHQRLEYGMDLRASFDFTNDGRRKFGRRSFKDISEAFYFVQQTGENSDVFEKIAANINMTDEKRRKFCLNLIEPMMIAFTGLFLMLLLVSFLLPVMTNTNII